MLRTVLVLLVLSLAVQAEIRDFTGVIQADSSFIHYSEGFIVAPGYIDLSDLSFSTLDNGGGVYDGEERDPTTDEDGGTGERNDDDDDTVDDDDNFPGDESVNPNKEEGGGRLLTDNAISNGSTLDIVFFNEPAECSNSRKGCDWTKLGIGANDGDGGVRWCCSNDAIDLGYCDGGGGQYGRLIVNSTYFQGQHRFINVPASGMLDANVHYAQLEEPTVSGKYILVIANCNDEGRDVLAKGKYTFKSAHGYLPGNLFGEMYFFAFLAGTYLVVALWYGINMKVYEDAAIPIQKWILGTIILGLLETFFRTGDYIVWNIDGTRFWFAMYTGVIIGVIKRGLSRCLIVMVSMGWGVVRDRLDQINSIIILGVMYVGTAAARDIMTIIAVTDNETLSINEEVDLVDAVTIITFIVAAIDVTFYMWILDALNATMQYLENMSQSIKLQRYLTLRSILLFSILFAVMWSVLSLVNTYMEDAILDEQQEWAVSAFMELNYLAVLIGVAWLWRPNASAKDLAYVMELPALGGDDNDLEMTSNIPSALDDSDDEDSEHFQDEPKNGA